MSSEGSPPDKDIEDILAGLGNVLKDITGPVPAGAAPPPAAQAPPPAAAAPPPAVSPAPKPDLPPPPAADQIRIELPPTTKPGVEVRVAQGIELAPRAGILGAKKPAEKKSADGKPPGLPRSEGIELRLNVASAGEPPTEPVPAPAPPPAPTPEAPPEAPLPEPIAAPSAEVAAPLAPPAPPAPPPPPDAPKIEFSAPAPAPSDPAPPAPAASEQVRQLAFLFSRDNEAACRAFAAFLASVALKVSKKPLYIEPVLFLEVGGELTATAALERARASGAVAVIALLGGLRPAQRKDLEEVFERGQRFFRVVAAEDADKRPFAIDLVVDLMLLKAEG